MTKTQQKKQEAAIKRILKNQAKATNNIAVVLQDSTGQIITDTYRMIELNHPLNLPLDTAERVHIDRVRSLFPNNRSKRAGYFTISPAELRIRLKAVKESKQRGLLSMDWPDWLIEINQIMVIDKLENAACRFNGRYLIDCMQALACKDTEETTIQVISNKIKSCSYYTYYLSTDQGRALLVGAR